MGSAAASAIVRAVIRAIASREERSRAGKPADPPPRDERTHANALRRGWACELVGLPRPYGVGRLLQG
jgi:hypothetical protein